jgi:hypothetical protein
VSASRECIGPALIRRALICPALIAASGPLRPICVALFTKVGAAPIRRRRRGAARLAGGASRFRWFNEAVRFIRGGPWTAAALGAPHRLVDDLGVGRGAGTRCASGPG